MLQLVSPFIIIYKALYLFIVSLTGNYGISLVLLSFITFLILLPFNKKAQQLQRKERKLQAILAPQIKAIKLNYSGQEQYEKLKRLYHRYAYHPLYAMRSVVGVLLQLPFLATAYYMLSGLPDIQGVSWGVIQNLGIPDQLLGGINLLPFVMTLVTVAYAFVMPDISKKERLQSVIIGLVFLVLLYAAPSALLIFWTSNLLWSLLFNVFEEKLQWIGSYVEDNELAFHIIFALSLTVGFFVPTEIYITNANQLWFSFKDVLQYYLTDTLKFIAILLLVYTVCWKKNIRCFYLSILFGLLLSVFLQSYIISVDYGVFDGHEIEWDKYTKTGVLNTFIWLFCLGETFVAFKRLKFDSEKIKRYVKPITLVLTVVQCSSLLLTLRNYPLPENAYGTKKFISVLTTKNMFNISSKDNIIVFLIDMFDASVFEEIIEKEPEVINELQGFTFYPDTTSVYGLTYTSLPQMLTGKVYYNDMSRSQYIEKAWKDNPYYATLINNNYDVGIYSTEEMATPDAPISNLVTENIVIDNDSLSNLKNLILFRMAPHYAKRVFYEYDPDFKFGLLVNKNNQAFQAHDRDFYLQLKKGLVFQHKNNCFRFYYLRGAHYPFLIDRNMEYIKKGTKGNVFEQSLGMLKIVTEYLKQLKQSNTFDNCTFVITADHGFHNKIGTRPLLCIKQPNSETVPMKISEEEISFSDFMPMLLERFYGEKGKSNSAELKKRYYYLQQERDFVEYEIVGNAKDLKSWNKKRVLGSWYKKQVNTYNLGEEIDCSDNNWNFETFQGTGWFEKPESGGSWSIGPESTLQFMLNDYKKGKDLLFSFTADSYISNLQYRTAKFYVNDIYITDVLFDNKNNDFSFIIPANIINSNLLRIRFTIDNNGLSIRDWGTLNDLSIFWKKIKIDYNK